MKYVLTFKGYLTLCVLCAGLTLLMMVGVRALSPEPGLPPVTPDRDKEPVTQTSPSAPLVENDVSPSPGDNFVDVSGDTVSPDTPPTEPSSSTPTPTSTDPATPAPSTVAPTTPSTQRVLSLSAQDGAVRLEDNKNAVDTFLRTLNGYDNVMILVETVVLADVLETPVDTQDAQALVAYLTDHGVPPARILMITSPATPDATQTPPASPVLLRIDVVAMPVSSK